MMKKLLSVFLVLVLAFSGSMLNGMNTANAQDNAPFLVNDVDVDGTNMIDVNNLYVERGQTINIRVEVQSDDENWPEVESGDVDENGNPIMVPNQNHVEEDVKVRAEIAGYEYDNIEDISSMFDIEYGVTYVKYLKLTIPEDLDASEDYKLNIRVYNQEYESRSEFPLMLRVKAPRHLLNLMDVIFTPGLSLNSNQPLFATVRVENLGDKKEENIKVSVSVPQLGREGVTYIDELVSGKEDDNNDIETSESSDAIYLDLRGAQSGTYDLIVRIEYNRGHEFLTKNYKLTIGGVSGQAGDLVVDSAEKSMSTESGKGVVYKIDIANLGTNARSFTAQVNGLDWGNFRVDPAQVVVQGSSNAEMFIYVSPNEGTQGQKTFTVNIMDGSNVVKQINFQTNIEEGKGEWDNVLTGLEIGFIVLLIILVILGIILAVTRMNKKENSEEPLGESYY